jgi:hypothetical protein
MEARNLEAKDANGFSDPYCMLGIIPGQRNKIDEIINEDRENFASHLSQSNFNRYPSNNNLNLNKMCTSPDFSLKNAKSVDQQHIPTPLTSGNSFSQLPISTLAQSSSKSSFIKRFSSFRRSEKNGSNNYSGTNPNTSASAASSTSQPIDRNCDVLGAASQIKSNNLHGSSHHHSHNTKNNEAIYSIGAIRDLKLPAKLIKTTDVKKATLSPKWNEKFQLFEKFPFFNNFILLIILISFLSQIDDINSDMFHLDIWDHDDEVSRAIDNRI